MACECIRHQSLPTLGAAKHGLYTNLDCLERLEDGRRPVAGRKSRRAAAWIAGGRFASRSRPSRGMTGVPRIASTARASARTVSSCWSSGWVTATFDEAPQRGRGPLGIRRDRPERPRQRYWLDLHGASGGCTWGRASSTIRRRRARSRSPQAEGSTSPAPVARAGPERSRLAQLYRLCPTCVQWVSLSCW